MLKYFFKTFVMTFYKNVSKIYRYIKLFRNHCKLNFKTNKIDLVETGIWAKRTV